MAFIPSANVARVNLQYQTVDGDIAENVYAVMSTGAWTLTDLENLLDAFFTWESTVTAGASPQGSRNSATSLIAGEARDLTTDTSPVFFGSPGGGPIVGLDVSAPMPNGISLAVKGTTGLPGRSFRSRTFWIGASVAWQTADKNQVTTATGGKLVTCLGNLIAAVTAADARWTLGVLSLSHNGAPRAAGVFTPVTNYSLTDFYFDYQRRRAPQHSRHH